MPVDGERVMKRAAIVIAIAGILLGLTASLLILYEMAGGWGAFLGLLLFPFTFIYLPLYALFVSGSWNLFLLNYGSIALSWVLLYAADRSEEKPRSAIEEPPTQPVATKENPSPAIVFMIIGGVIVIAILCALTLGTI